jgi:hypothetical protein
MADMYQPILNQSDFSPNTGAMVNRLKGSNAMADAIGDLGKIAIQGAVQYGEQKKVQQLADVKAQVDAAIDPLIQEGLLGSPSYKKEQTDELAAWQETQNRLPYAEAPEDEFILEGAISKVQSELDKRVDFLTRAKDQGRLSTFDFEQRLLSITRKYISDNPGLRDEILSTAKNKLEDQGIIARLKLDEQTSKDQAASYESEVKNIRDNFEKFNIPELPYRMPDGTLNIRSSQMAIDRMRTAKAANDAFSSDMDFNKKATEAEQLQMETSGVVPLIVEGKYNDTIANISQIFTTNAADFPKAKLQAQAFLSQQIAQFKSDPRIAKWAGSQVVKDGMVDYEKNVTALKNAMESFNSMEDLQKFTQSQRQFMQDTQSMNLMKDFDVPRMELMLKMSSVGNLINTPEGQNYIKNVLIQTRDMFTSDKLNTGFIFNKAPGTNQTGASIVVNQAMQNVDSKRPETAQVASQVLSGVIEGINDPKVSPSAMDQMKRADTLFTDIGKAEYMDKFIDADPELSNKLTTLLGKYNDQIDIDLQRYIATNPEKKIKLEINPGTGMVYAQGADTAFNSTFTTRINNSLKAYANFRVQTPKEVWKDFYQEFFPSISQGKTITSTANEKANPLNLKDTKGEFRSFNSLEDAVGAYESQLLSYATGKGVAGGKPRNTIKSIIDLWRPASDYRGETDITQQQYYDAVSNYLAKSPNTVLDLNDKETMAKLIAGMAKVESNTDLDWLRVSSLLKKVGNKKSMTTKALESSSNPDNFTNPGVNK